jgi:hypothetical protein
MKTDWKAPILAALGLVALAVAIPMGVANAQSDDQNPPQRGDQRTQGGPPQGGFQGQPGQDMRPDMMQRMGGMGGGPATMVTDNAFLYILQGNTLYKVNKNNLEVVGQGMLPMPGPRFEGGPDRPGPGAPGVRGGGGGGGAAAGGAGGRAGGGGGE